MIDGVGDFSFELSSRLRQRGFNCSVCTLRNCEVLGFCELRKDKNVFFSGDRWNLTSYLHLVKYLKANRPDIIFLQYVPHAFSRYGLPFHLILIPLMAAFYKIRFDTMFHEVSVRIKGAGLKSSIVGLLQLVIACILSLLSKKIYTTNRRYANYLKPFKAQVIFTPPNIYKPASTSLPISPENIPGFSIVSFLNRCDDKLLEAFKLFRESSDPESILILVGYHDHIKQIEESIKQKNLEQFVLIVRNSSADAIADHIQAADIYVQIEAVGEKNEGGVSTKSGCLSTALSLGKSIISTRGDLTDSDIFIDKYNILFVRYGNIESYFNAFMKLRNNRFLIKQMEINARQIFNTSFTWSICMDKIEHSFLD